MGCTPVCVRTILLMMTVTLSQASLLLCGHCPVGSLAALCPTWASIFCTFGFSPAEILAGLGSMWEQLRHVMPPLGSSLLALPKKENLFYVSLLFLFFFLQGCFLCSSFIRF